MNKRIDIDPSFRFGRRSLPLLLAADAVAACTSKPPDAQIRLISSREVSENERIRELGIESDVEKQTIIDQYKRDSKADLQELLLARFKDRYPDLFFDPKGPNITFALLRPHGLRSAVSVVSQIGTGPDGGLVTIVSESYEKQENGEWLRFQNNVLTNLVRPNEYGRQIPELTIVFSRYPISDMYESAVVEQAGRTVFEFPQTMQLKEASIDDDFSISTIL